jgi:photosynthetic reaction center H subunit
MAHGGPKILPLRVATDFSIANGDPEPRGMKVIGADGEIAGVCSDVWVDKAECLIRYLEVELGAPSAVGLSRVGAAPLAKRVLVPMPMVVVSRGRGTIKVAAILAAQFANVPALASPDQITKDEEERVAAYYGGGYLYATPARLEPLI